MDANQMEIKQEPADDWSTPQTPAIGGNPSSSAVKLEPEWSPDSRGPDVTTQSPTSVSLTSENTASTIVMPSPTSLSDAITATSGPMTSLLTNASLASALTSPPTSVTSTQPPITSNKPLNFKLQISQAGGLRLAPLQAPASTSQASRYSGPDGQVFFIRYTADGQPQLCMTFSSQPNKLYLLQPSAGHKLNVQLNSPLKQSQKTSSPTSPVSKVLLDTADNASVLQCGKVTGQSSSGAVYPRPQTKSLLKPTVKDSLALLRTGSHLKRKFVDFSGLKASETVASQSLASIAKQANQLASASNLQQSPSRQLVSDIKKVITNRIHDASGHFTKESCASPEQLKQKRSKPKATSLLTRALLSCGHHLDRETAPNTEQAEEETDSATEVEDEDCDAHNFPFKIDTVFSLATEEVQSDDSEEAGMNEEKPITVEDFYQTHSLTQDEMLDICGSSFVVLERLHKNDIDEKRNCHMQSRCSDYCRKRTLNYLCMLGLIRCSPEKRKRIKTEDDDDEVPQKMIKKNNSFSDFAVEEEADDETVSKHDLDRSEPNVEETPAIEIEVETSPKTESNNTEKNLDNGSFPALVSSYKQGKAHVFPPSSCSVPSSSPSPPVTSLKSVFTEPVTAVATAPRLATRQSVAEAGVKLPVQHVNATPVSVASSLNAASAVSNVGWEEFGMKTTSEEIQKNGGKNVPKKKNSVVIVSEPAAAKAQDNKDGIHKPLISTCHPSRVAIVSPFSDVTKPGRIVCSVSKTGAVTSTLSPSVSKSSSVAPRPILPYTGVPLSQESFKEISLCHGESLRDSSAAIVYPSSSSVAGTVASFQAGASGPLATSISKPIASVCSSSAAAILTSSSSAPKTVMAPASQTPKILTASFPSSVTASSTSLLSSLLTSSGKATEVVQNSTVAQTPPLSSTVAVMVPSTQPTGGVPYLVLFGNREQLLMPGGSVPSVSSIQSSMPSYSLVSSTGMPPSHLASSIQKLQPSSTSSKTVITSQCSQNGAQVTSAGSSSVSVVTFSSKPQVVSTPALPVSQSVAQSTVSVKSGAAPVTKTPPVKLTVVESAETSRSLLVPRGQNTVFKFVPASRSVSQPAVSTTPPVTIISALGSGTNTTASTVKIVQGQPDLRVRRVQSQGVEQPKTVRPCLGSRGQSLTPGTRIIAKPSSALQSSSGSLSWSNIKVIPVTAVTTARQPSLVSLIPSSSSTANTQSTVKIVAGSTLKGISIAPMVTCSSTPIASRTPLLRVPGSVSLLPPSLQQTANTSGTIKVIVRAGTASAHTVNPSVKTPPSTVSQSVVVTQKSVTDVRKQPYLKTLTSTDPSVSSGMTTVLSSAPSSTVSLPTTVHCSKSSITCSQSLDTVSLSTCSKASVSSAASLQSFTSPASVSSNTMSSESTRRPAELAVGRGEDKARAKRARFEKRYPIPPGVMIKSEPETFGYPTETTSNNSPDNDIDEVTPSSLSGPISITETSSIHRIASWPSQTICSTIVPCSSSSESPRISTDCVESSTPQRLRCDESLVDCDERSDQQVTSDTVGPPMDLDCPNLVDCDEQVTSDTAGPPTDLDCPNLDTFGDRTVYDEPPVLTPVSPLRPRHQDVSDDLDISSADNAGPVAPTQLNEFSSSLTADSTRKTKRKSKKRKLSSRKVSSQRDSSRRSATEGQKPAILRAQESSGASTSSVTSAARTSSVPVALSTSSETLASSASASDRIRKLKEMLRKQNKELEELRRQRAMQGPSLCPNDD